MWPMASVAGHGRAGVPNITTQRQGHVIPGGVEAARAAQDGQAEKRTRQAIMSFAGKVMVFIAKRTEGVGGIGKERKRSEKSRVSTHQQGVIIIN